MWESRVEWLDDGRGQQVTLLRDDTPVCYGDVVSAWQTDTAFRERFIDLLAACPYPAIYWETPPVSDASLDQRFECVLLESTYLSKVPADRSAFVEHFDSAAVRDDVVAFPNLGHDALLVAPCPVGPVEDYAHLAAFARAAPRSQQHALWQRVGAEIETTLVDDRPIWVSTAGQGVFWLHVRLDVRPKYYNHAPYTRTTGSRAGPGVSAP